MSCPVDPLILARAQRIIELRRRYNASGQDAPDMTNILAALAEQHPGIGQQQELFAA